MASYHERFVAAYEAAALWSSTYEWVGDFGATITLNMDDGKHDLAPEARKRFRKDCERFIAANAGDLDLASDDPSQHGHDLWLTRNRHGCGFWDRGYGPVGDRLTEAAQAMGECDLYIGDDGLIYAEG